MTSDAAPLLPQVDGWLVTTLGQLCRRNGSIQTGPFGSQLHAADYIPNGIPSIMPQDIFDGRVDEARIARISLEDAERLSRYRVRVGDIVCSRRGDLRRRVLIGPGQEGWLCGTGCLRIRPPRNVHPSFLAAYLAHPAVEGWIERHAVGATMLNLSTRTLSSLPVSLPAQHEQQRIATTLSALDDKIDNNRRLAVLLEASASALFECEFLLARDRDVWPLRQLGDLAEVIMGQSPPGASYTLDGNDGNGKFTLVQGMGGFGQRFPTSTTFTSEPTRVVAAGATLMTVRAPVGAVNIARTRVCIGRGVAGFTSDFPAFTEFLVRSLGDRWASEESGTIFPAVNGKQIVGLPVREPPHEAISAFEAAAGPIVAKLSALHDESQSLAAIRDELLPKLISGEIRVAA